MGSALQGTLQPVVRIGAFHHTAVQSTTRVGLMEAFLKRGLTPPTPAVESPSFFYSLAVVAQTDLLTCCAQSAALHSSHATSILPLIVSQEPMPVSLVWRKSSEHAQRLADDLT